MTSTTFGPLNRATTTFRGLNKATTTFGVTHATDDSLDAGSYVITGQDALFPVSRQMVAAQGSYSLTGQDAVLPVTRKTVAEQGTYSITGQDAAFPASLIIGAEQGSYSITGQDTAFPVTRKLEAAQGTYTITGQDASFPVSGAAPGQTTIGTNSRDYSTITLWEADLDDSGVYSANDDAVGEIYNDSAFDESFTIDGGGTIGLNSVTLTVAQGERHDGTAGTGARIVRTASGTVSTLSIANTSIQWLEMDCQAINYNTIVICDDVENLHIDHLILFGFAGSDVWNGHGLRLWNFAGSAGNSSFHNSIVYGIEATKTNDNRGVENQFDAFSYYNLTIHAITNTSANSGVGFRDDGSSVAGQNFQNILVTDCDTCFSLSDPDPTRSHNASSDATASGTGSLTNITTADQYVSTVGGSEDLHLKTGADCIDAGTDLGTTPSGVEIDIDGNDRTAAVTWDIGAHEFEL